MRVHTLHFIAGPLDGQTVRTVPCDMHRWDAPPSLTPYMPSERVTYVETLRISEFTRNTVFVRMDLETVVEKHPSYAERPWEDWRQDVGVS